jgi:type IV secretory pathway protease TraF
VKKKRILYAVIVLSALLALAVRPGKIFIVNVTASSPRGLYLVSGKPPAPGDFVVINSGRLLFNNGIQDTLFLKKVAFAGNERVVIDRSRMTVDAGEFKKFNDAGISYDGLLKDGECILLGTGERSLDSRYFGPVRLDDCTRVIPLFTGGAYE